MLGDRRPATVVAIIAALAVFATGCAFRLPEPAAPDVVVFSPWVGVDADRFDKVLAGFTEETGISVRNTGSANFEADLLARVNDGDAPDVAVSPQPGLVDDLIASGQITPLRGAAESAATQAYPPLVDLVSHDDEIWGAWFELSVKSLVWFDPAVLAQYGDAPKSLADLADLGANAVSDGLPPWCVALRAFGASGWPGTDWVEDLILRFQGTEVFDAWVSGEIPFTDDRITQSINSFSSDVIGPGRAATGSIGPLRTFVEDGADPLFEAPPGCLFHRQASFLRPHLPEGAVIAPDGDVDFFVLPPAVEGDPTPILVGGSVAVTFSEEQKAQRLIEYLATPDSADPFANAGGFISPYPDFDADRYLDDVDRRIAQIVEEADILRFDGSDLMPPSVGTGTFWEGIMALASGSSVAESAELMQSGWGGVDRLNTASTTSVPGN
jgi:alpha-glucoside transport system substrate-binding protein